ncbi:MAG: hypothetical protein QOH79_3752 [Acidimicrobiaceae bacterium]
MSPPERAAAIIHRAGDSGVTVAEIGHAGGNRLVVRGLVDLALTEVQRAWRTMLPLALGQGTVQS